MTSAVATGLIVGLIMIAAGIALHFGQRQP